MKNLLLGVVTAGMLLTGCKNMQDMRISNHEAVTLVGAVAGGVIGGNIGAGQGKIVGAVIGTIAGGLFGNWLGENLDENNQQKHVHTTMKSLEYGKDEAWEDKKAHAKGHIKTTKTYHTKDGKMCREYTQKVTINKKEQTAHGTACKVKGGQWKIVN